MYVTKYKDKFRAFERYKVGDTWRKISVVMEKNTPQERRKAAALLAEKMDAPTTGITYSRLVKDYINYQKAVFKPSTWMRNEASLTRLIDTFGDASLDKMTAGFISSRLLQKTQNPGTYNEYLKRLKGLFHWAYRNDYIPTPACVDKIKPLKDIPAAEKVADKFLEVSELKRIIDAAPEFYAPLFEFLALSGLRIGELIALDDTDVTETEIIVNKTYVHQTGGVNTPKTEASARRVHIQPELKPCIQNIRRNTRIYSMSAGSRCPYFAVNITGGRLSYVNVNNAFKRTCERVLGRKLTVHALRHTHVALMAEKGVDLKVIARRLGHSSSKITEEIYYHVTEKQREKDNAVIDSVRIFG